MLKLGWFSSGRGEGSRGLLRLVQEKIEQGELEARIEFVFCNREPGEAQGSDTFMEQVRGYRLPLVWFSSRRFRRERGAPFEAVREEYDREVLRRIGSFSVDLCVLAGYMLIVGPELCRRYPMINLHPALPGGPVGSWQQVIWQLIATRASETGAMVHLVNEDVDRGPPITYVRFSLRGPLFDPLWQAIRGRPLEDLKAREGEELPLFRTIREEEVKRERPLLLETLKLMARGRLRIREGRVLDEEGRPVSGYCLNEAVEKVLACP